MPQMPSPQLLHLPCKRSKRGDEMNNMSNGFQSPTSTSNEPVVGTNMGDSRRSFAGNAVLAGIAIAAG